MTESLATLLAAHAKGKAVRSTIDETYDRVGRHNDPALFIALRPRTEALAIAERLQAAGPEGRPLFGAPFVVKDNIDVSGLPTTAACPAFAYQPEKSAFVVERLERAGAIVVGKTNLDQFATGLVGVRSPYGVPRNALRPDLVPGGSSSGSATAVGAGLVPFSLGTDTAGSGRVPAALNGIVGLKPSLGALSAAGVVPACRTLDTISIFARDVADAFAVFAAACGYDESDAFSRPFPPPALSAVPGGLRIGVPRPDQLEFFGDAESEVAFKRDLAAVEALGLRRVEFDLAPFAEVARLLYEGPWVAERYAATKPLIETNPEALHPVTRAIIEGARKFDAVAAFEAFYKLADRRRRAERVWSEIDVMVVPTIPRPYSVAEVMGDPIGLNSRTRDLHQLRQSARPCRHRCAVGNAWGRPAFKRDPHRSVRDGRPPRRSGRGDPDALGRADGRDGSEGAKRAAAGRAGRARPRRACGRRRASGRTAVEPRTCRARRDVPARGRDDEGLSSLRAAGFAVEAGAPESRQWRGDRGQGRAMEP